MRWNGPGDQQAAARTFPYVLTEIRNQIEFFSHEGSPYLIDLNRENLEH
jgi:hypothetical protein